MDKIKDLEKQIQCAAMQVIERRFTRLQTRPLLFPWLRYKWLLKKLRFVKGS